MGVAGSCGASSSCGKSCAKADTKSSSRVENTREDYDYPGSPDKARNLDEEQIEPAAWDTSKLKSQDEVNGLVAQYTKDMNGFEETKLNGAVKENGEASPYEGKVEIATMEVNASPRGQSPDRNGSSNIVVSEPEPEKEEENPVSAERNDDNAASPGEPASPDSGHRRISWKRAAKKALLAKNMGAKIAIENKIGKKLEGWFRDVALELQRGIAAEGKKQEYTNFEAPEHALFARCRTACGFTEVRYFATMGLQDGLTEPNLALIGNQDAAGKSGSFFFLSPDQQLIAKSCTKEDWVTLLRILPLYVEHVEAARRKANARKEAEGNQISYTSAGQRQTPREGSVRGFTDTLLPRYLALYRLTLPGAAPKTEPVLVVVMANVFGGALSIDRRYDLKGSTHGRAASRKEKAKKAPTFKDIDWVSMEPGLRLNKFNRIQLLEAIREDLKFLEKQRLMDYSLLVGVHDIAKGAPSVYEAMNVVTVRDSTRHCYLGIIDVLTPYRMKKRAETFFLGTIRCGLDVSCQHPKVYARRFFKFADKQVFDLADGEDKA
jgi:hypothetical protein